MRPEQAGASTALLAAAALWALLVWVLALAGLGGRVAPLADDPALLQPLPQAQPPAAGRLGPPPQYAAIGERPLFSEDRRHRPFFIEGDADEAGAPDFDVVLTSVLITPGLQMAIVQPREGGESLRVRVGDAPRGFGNWALRSVSPREAVFAGPDGERVLALRVYDGTGGQPPTAMRTPPPGAAMSAEQAAQAAQARAQAAAAAAARTSARDTGVGAASAPQPAPPPRADPAAVVEGGDSAPRAADPTPTEQAEAIRRRIEARRARLQAERAAQRQNPVESP